MERVMVRYKVKPDQVTVNEELVRAVYAELAVAQPAGMRYATFRLEDGLSFVHVHSNETGGANPLSSLPAFQAFQANVRERCDEPPVVTRIEEIGSYRFFGDGA